MKSAFASLICVSALALTSSSCVSAAGFGDLLRPIIGDSDSGGAGLLGSILGPVKVVSGDFVTVNTRVGSPSTVIEKGVPSKGGLSISGPSFVRVSTDVDSENTEIRTGPSKAPVGASPAPPAVTDPEIALALAKPRPTSAAALSKAVSSSVASGTTAVSSSVASAGKAISSIFNSVFGAKVPATAPPAPASAPRTPQLEAAPSASSSYTPTPTALRALRG